VRLLYGDRYDALIPLLPFFGLLMLIRYAGTSYGTLLTLADRQLVRALAVIGMVLLGVAINAALIPHFGLAGAIVAAILSHIGLYSVYVVATWKDHRTLLIDGRSTALLGVATVALLLVLLPVDTGEAVRVQLGAVLVLVTATVGITRTEWSALSRRLARVR
jgi:O-antigen/teichoic acid export membrane protein